MCVHEVLQYCKDKGVIDSIPAVSSTKYTYGHPAEVCAGELVEVAVAAVQQSVSQSGPVAEKFASVGPEPAWNLEDFPDLHGMAPTAGKHAELLVSDLSPVPRLLSCGGENGAMVDAAELSSISVEAPSQWVWPLDSGVGT